MQKYHYMYARDVAVIKMAARVVSVHTAMPYARTADGYLNPGTHCGILNDFYKTIIVKGYQISAEYVNIYHSEYTVAVSSCLQLTTLVSVHTAMPYARTADGYLNPGTQCGILNNFY